MQKKSWSVLKYYPITLLRKIRNYGLEGIREVIMAYFRTLSQHLSGGIEKKQKTPQSGLQASGLGFDTVISRQHCWNANHRATFSFDNPL
jgi:hypothetical protein